VRREPDRAAEEAEAAFHVLLREHRLAAALTQEALAERAGLSTRAIQNLERGDRRPYPDTVGRLAAALGLDGAARAAFEAVARPPRRREGAGPGRPPPGPAGGRRRGQPDAAAVTHLFLERMGAGGVPGSPGAGGPAAEPRTNLPAALTACIGREAERAEVAVRLATARLVTLTGPGGCGKTRVALQIAADLAEAGTAPEGARPAESPELEDGVWLVELAALGDPALVPQAVAEVLAVREEPGRTLLETLPEALADRRLLLVLDNCEHLLEACARLADALLRACPHLRLLATSRRPLGMPGEVVRPVPPLGVPPPEAGAGADPATLMRYPAVRLFAERAAGAAPGFAVTSRNAPAVAAICRRLDGLPLALELAAARARGLAPEHLASRLDEPFRLLASGSAAALPRQQTLRATVDWSHNLLSEAERVLFRRLAVFAGGFALEAAEAVGADGGDAGRGGDVDTLLPGLVDASLVVAGGEPEGAPRYGLLETLRSYAGERLEASGEAETIRGRHAGYYLGLAQQATAGLDGPEQAAWLDLLEGEHDNLRQALRWLAERGDAGQAVRLGATLSTFWRHRGYLSEGRAQLEVLLALPGAAPPSPERVQALQMAGELAHLQADYGAARALGEEGLALRRALGDRCGLGGALSYLGVIVREQGDYPTARALLEESLRLDGEVGRHYSMAHSHIRLGEVAHAEGDYAQARHHYEASRALFESLRTSWGRLPHHFGLLALDEGDLAAARAHLDESLRLHEAQRERAWLPASLAAFACLAAAGGQSRRALQLAGAVEALRERSGTVLQATERVRFERWLAAARGDLDLATAAAAWEAGRAMSAEEAAAFALQE
jgi:predicted ATPase/DNA-binding XRE family transcriptional regulator